LEKSFKGKVYGRTDKPTDGQEVITTAFGSGEVMHYQQTKLVNYKNVPLARST